MNYLSPDACGRYTLANPREGKHLSWTDDDARPDDINGADNGAAARLARASFFRRDTLAEGNAASFCGADDGGRPR